MQKRKNQENFEAMSQRAIFLEQLEFYLFIIIASGVWCFLAYFTLKTLKFPFHAHPYETTVIFVVPVIAISLILKFIEGKMRVKED